MLKPLLIFLIIMSIINLGATLDKPDGIDELVKNNINLVGKNEALIEKNRKLIMDKFQLNQKLVQKEKEEKFIKDITECEADADLELIGRTLTWYNKRAKECKEMSCIEDNIRKVSKAIENSELYLVLGEDF